MVIYVGNISYSLTADGLRAVFSPYGNVLDVKIITDKATGKSRGYGFVEMENDEQAKRAIAELNNSPVMGRNIKVNNAFRKTDSQANPQAAHRASAGGHARTGASDVASPDADDASGNADAASSEGSDGASLG